MLPVFIDTVENPVFEMQEKEHPEKTQFVKRYAAEGGRGVVAAFRFIKDGKKKFKHSMDFHRATGK